MKKTITKNDIMNLMGNLEDPALLSYEGVKFAYALSKNRGKLKTEVKAITDAVKVTDEMIKFMGDWINLTADELVKKVKLMKANREENKDLSEQQISEMDASDKILAEKILEKLKENKTFIEGKIEIDLYKIELEDLPKNIKGNHFRGLEILIMEDDKPVAPEKPVAEKSESEKPTEAAPQQE